MKSSIIRNILIVCYSLLCYSCIEDPEMPTGVQNAKQPLVETITIKEFTATTATMEANIVRDNGAEIIERGFQYGTEKTLLNEQKNAEKGKGVYSLVLDHLTANQTYYVRAFAENKIGISYSETLTFTTTNSVWKKVNEYPGAAFFPGSATSFAIKDKGYILGGDLGASYSNELWSYSSAENKWAACLAFPNEARKWQTAISLDDVVYVFGGMDNKGGVSDDMYYYRSYDNTWVKIKSEGPAPTHSAVAATLNYSFYLVGGKQAKEMSNEVWLYVPVVRTWLKQKEFPIAQYGGMVVNVNGVLYAGLGMTDDYGKTTRSIWSSEWSEDGYEIKDWNEETKLPEEASACRNAVVLDDCIFVLDNKGKIWKYDPKSKEWEKKSPISETGSYRYHCMFVVDGKIYLGLGEDDKTLMCYDPDWDI